MTSFLRTYLLNDGMIILSFRREIFTFFSTRDGNLRGYINNISELFLAKQKRCRTTLLEFWTVTELLIKYTASNAVIGTRLQWHITLHQTEILICAFLRYINRKSFFTIWVPQTQTQLLFIQQCVQEYMYILYRNDVCVNDIAAK